MSYLARTNAKFTSSFLTRAYRSVLSRQSVVNKTKNTGRSGGHGHDDHGHHGYPEPGSNLPLRQVKTAKDRKVLATQMITAVTLAASFPILNVVLKRNES